MLQSSGSLFGILPGPLRLVNHHSRLPGFGVLGVKRTDHHLEAHPSLTFVLF